MNESLRDAISTPERKRHYTRRVFATIANRYDLVNVLLSFNRDQAWKRRMVARANVRSDDVALDLACGTGDITFLLARRGARVVGLDVTPRMIELAREKARQAEQAGLGGHAPPSSAREGARRSPDFLVGDMMSLPFPAQTFDLVTTGYGIRNVPDIEGALREIHRVLAPGGRFLSLDFNRPTNRWIRGAFLAWLTVVGSAFGWALHGDADTYRYIPETIRTYPGAAGIVSLLNRSGFEQAAFEPVFGGFMALHTATKPARDGSRHARRG